MKKETLVAICLAIPGGILFSLGMVMGLMTEWDMLVPGVVMGVIGLLVLLLIIPIYRKMTGAKRIQVNSKILLTSIVGVIGSIILGIGMSLCLVETDKSKMIMGILIGVLGLLIVTFNPVIYLARNNKDEVCNRIKE